MSQFSNVCHNGRLLSVNVCLETRQNGRIVRRRIDEFPSKINVRQLTVKLMNISINTLLDIHVSLTVSCYRVALCWEQVFWRDVSRYFVPLLGCAVNRN